MNKTPRKFAPDPSNYVSSKSATRSAAKSTKKSPQTPNKQLQITLTVRCRDPEKYRKPFLKQKTLNLFFKLKKKHGES